MNDGTGELQKWNAEYRSAATSRQSYERVWLRNVAFVFGKQWVNWSEGSAVASSISQVLVEPLPKSGKKRLTINYCRMYVQKHVAKMNKEKPRGFVVPSSSDNADVAAARAGEKLLEYLQTETHLSPAFERADFWVAVCGTSFLKTWYNPGFTFPTMLGQQPEGAPVVEEVSPFHILVPDLSTPTLEGQPWVMHESVRTKSQIRQQFPDADLTKIQDEGVLGNTLIDTRLLTAAGKNQSENKKKGIVVREVWVKPCEDYPQGAVITYTKDTIIQKIDGWPVPFKEYPFYRRQFYTTGMFYGETPVTDVVPIQVEYNSSRSRILENRDKMANLQLIAERGTVDVRKLNTNPGLVVEYKPGMKPPTPLQLQGLPGYVLDALERSKSEMDDLMSQHEISEGRVPPGVEAATAIAYLGENQDSNLSSTIRDKEIAHQTVCRQLLAYVATYWDAERLVGVVGANNNFEAFKFKGADLRNNTDFRVVVGSATPISHAAKQAQIMELMRSGYIPAAKGLQYLELGDTAKLYEEMQLDEREAERENVRMSQGVPVEVSDWQEHLIHIKTHDNMRKRQEFEILEPAVKELVRFHVFMHMYFVATSAGANIPLPPETVQNGIVNAAVERNLRMFIQDYTREVTSGNAPR